MPKNMGEKIKQLRKEYKLTQTDLAGSEMTKSMLSQIENNVAMPSMKNLQYLASRLNKPMVYFLQDSSQHAALPMEEIHQESNNITSLIRSRKHQEVVERIEALLGRFQFDKNSRIYADLLVKLGDSLIDIQKHCLGEEKIKEAIQIYKDNFLFIEAAKAHLKLIGIPWNEFDYEKCIEILEQSLDIYGNSLNKDYAFEIEALHIRSILNAGLDRLEDCIDAAEKALSISKQTSIYYNSDELYKVIAIMNFFLGNLDSFECNIEKARQFAVFTDNLNILASIECACSIFYNKIINPRKALEHAEKALKLSNSIPAAIYTEKTKAFYAIGEYQQALEWARKVVFPSYIPFKYDYLHLCTSKIYEGLILNKLGQREEALNIIMSGIQKMEVIGASKTLSFAYKSLSEVYSDEGDFQKAFSALKKSNEIEQTAKENRLYY